MIKLDNWYIVSYPSSREKGKEHYVANGVISGHPRLDDGIDARTSRIESAKRDGDNVILLTHSHNEYYLSLSSISIGVFDTTKSNLEKLGVSISKEECEDLINKRSKLLLEKAGSVISNNELYLQTLGVYVQKAYFKNSDGELREIEVGCHSGMFQDSYLITDWDKGEVDFRYFDKLMTIEPYHWSDGLRAVDVDNVGDTDIRLLDKVCKAGELTKVDKPENMVEGLLSPDAVNGKSIFSLDSEE